MLSHRFHPDARFNDPPDALLYDGCERCTEHARMLVTLDDVTLEALYKLAFSGSEGRTNAEQKAVSAIYRATLVHRSLTRLGLLSINV